MKLYVFNEFPKKLAQQWQTDKWGVGVNSFLVVSKGSFTLSKGERESEVSSLIFVAT